MSLFTPQNAALMAAKAHESRRRNYLAAKEANNRQSQSAQLTPAIAAKTTSVDAFSRARLARVCRQLERLDDMMETEEDP